MKSVSICDYNVYDMKYIDIPNTNMKIKCILTQNKLSNLNCFSCIVNTGSLMDYYDYQGIAHFLEHMIFMGSNKYNDPDLFITTVDINKGLTNAFTS